MNLSQLKHEEMRSQKTGEVFSHTSVLTDLLGFKDLFIHHEILPPGRRASSPHAHSHREEAVFVLKGSPTAHVGTQSHTLTAGDFLGFKPGSNELHFIENTTTSEVELLVVASNPKEDETVY